MSEQPDDCPKSPTGETCSILDVATGSERIKFLRQCSRCGWVDPKYLDDWVEDALKRGITKVAQRLALASSGIPFTFVQSSTEPLTLQEGLSQAFAAASLAWDEEPGGSPDVQRSKQIYEQTLKLIAEFMRAGEKAAYQKAVDDAWTSARNFLGPLAPNGGVTYVDTTALLGAIAETGV